MNQERGRDNGIYEDDCPQAPVPAVEQPLSIQVHPSTSHYEKFVAFLSPNSDLRAERLTIGLVFGETRYDAAAKMLGILDQLGMLNGREIPIVFAKD